MNKMRYEQGDPDDNDPIDPEEIAATRRWLLQKARQDPSISWMVAALDGMGVDPFWEYDEDLSDLDGDGPF